MILGSDIEWTWLNLWYIDYKIRFIGYHVAKSAIIVFSNYTERKEEEGGGEEGGVGGIGNLWQRRIISLAGPTRHPTQCTHSQGEYIRVLNRKRRKQKWGKSIPDLFQRFPDFALSIKSDHPITGLHLTADGEETAHQKKKGNCTSHRRTQPWLSVTLF